MGDLKSTIRINLIENNILRTDDVNLATKSYGPDVWEIKGKTTRIRPTPFVSIIVEVPE